MGTTDMLAKLNGRTVTSHSVDGKHTYVIWGCPVWCFLGLAGWRVRCEIKNLEPESEVWVFPWMLLSFGIKRDGLYVYGGSCGFPSDLISCDPAVGGSCSGHPTWGSGWLLNLIFATINLNLMFLSCGLFRSPATIARIAVGDRSGYFPVQQKDAVV